MSGESRPKDFVIVDVNNLPDHVNHELNIMIDRIQKATNPIILGKDMNQVLSALTIQLADLISRYCINPEEVASGVCVCLKDNVERKTKK